MEVITACLGEPAVTGAVTPFSFFTFSSSPLPSAPESPVTEQSRSKSSGEQSSVGLLQILMVSLSSRGITVPLVYKGAFICCANSVNEVLTSNRGSITKQLECISSLRFSSHLLHAGIYSLNKDKWIILGGGCYMSVSWTVIILRFSYFIWAVFKFMAMGNSNETNFRFSLVCIFLDNWAVHRVHWSCNHVPCVLQCFSMPVLWRQLLLHLLKSSKSSYFIGSALHTCHLLSDDRDVSEISWQPWVHSASHEQWACSRTWSLGKGSVFASLPEGGQGGSRMCFLGTMLCP